jgi:hypothetical protein
MKKNYLLLIILLLCGHFLGAQTTEVFETETHSSATFSEGGITFNITSQAAALFDIQANYAGTGWSGTAPDNRYIDNSGASNANQPVEFTISAANGAVINLKSMWLFLSNNDLELSAAGTCTVTGKLNGVTKFTAVQGNPFNASVSVSNGFTLFDMATYGGANNSTINIDQFTIKTTGQISYVALDAMTFTCAPVSIASTTKTDVSCNGGSNGTAGITSSGGTLSYNWAPGNPAGDGTASVTGLTAGTWTCTITNACGSTNTATFSIGQPSVLSATTSQTNILCYGNATGTAGVTASGGTSPYTYLWNTGATTASITDRTAGTYSVTITDSKGCTTTKSVILTQPAAALAAGTVQTNILCNGGNTGSAGVIVSGGTTPYTYLWTGGATAALISNKTAGSYSVTITDAGGCTLTKTITITQPAAALAAGTTQTNILCNGSATGAAGVTPSGGTAPYTYSWTGGATTASISNKTAGTYSVTITDFNGCTLTKSITITQSAAVIASSLINNVACYGGQTGTAGVTVSGGTAPYTYLWNTGATAAVLYGVAAGTYTVTVTDVNGCTANKSIAVTQPAAPLSAVTMQTNVLCNGSATGSAAVTPSGGTAGYTYLWNTGATGTSISNVTAGMYSVTITDSKNCVLTKNFTITQPAAPLAATTTQTNVLCAGMGSATVNATGGTGAYAYAWSPSGGNVATATGLAVGTYTVTVTDANACVLTKTVTIIQTGAPVNATVAATNVQCNGQTNGTATVTATGGNGTFTYTWSPAVSTSATASNLAPGNYTVTVTDGNGCSSGAKSFIITQPSALSATLYPSNAICQGSSTGAIYIDNVSGGTQPYTYLWSNGATTASAYNLAAGNHTLTITDANGCTASITRTLTEPAMAVSATFTTTNVSCNGSVNGAVNIVPSGGIAPYDYTLYPSVQYFSNPNITGLAPGDYSVRVQDAYNCNTTIYFTITEPAPLAATTTQVDQVCYGMSGPASATVYPTGGTPPYTYQWNNGAGNEATATGLGTTNYTVTVTDANGCTVQKTVTITEAGECGVTTTWNGTQWSNGLPLCEAYAVIIEGDLTVTQDIVACSLTVNSGNVVVSSGTNINLMYAVTVAGGSLTFESDAYLHQYTDAQNVGSITYKRESNALYNLDYTAWSSPVSGSQTLKAFSPQTLNTHFYVYNTALNAFSNYLSASGIFGSNPNAQAFVPGKGYLIRMPDGISNDVPTTFTGAFQGTPHNGDINIPLSTAGSRFNAVGNPYPEPLRLYTFVMHNQQNLDNGTLYFWRKRNGSTETTYTTISLAGSVESGGGNGEGGESGEGEGGEGNQAYTFAIKPGQGFFVKASATATNLNFNNYMRWSSDFNSQFYRQAGQTTVVPDSKLWLNITNAANVFGQTAIAYMQNTTLNLDYGYDGRLYNDGVAALYTTAQDTRLSIQARDVFNADDEVALSYKTTTAGSFTISLDHYTGLFNQGQNIYLKDLMLGITHNLTNNGGYTFITEEGTVSNRFVVVYKEQQTAGLEDFSVQNIIAYKADNAIMVNSGTGIMKGIEVYDLRGRLLYKNNDVNASDFKITGLAIQEQMVIVQVTTTQGYKVSKKIIY